MGTAVRGTLPPPPVHGELETGFDLLIIYYFYQHELAFLSIVHSPL